MNSSSCDNLVNHNLGLLADATAFGVGDVNGLLLDNDIDTATGGEA